MIGTGVSKNRVVVSLPDDQMDFLEELATSTGLGRAHVVRKALAAFQNAVERARAIEQDAAQNEGPY